MEGQTAESASTEQIPADELETTTKTETETETVTATLDGTATAVTAVTLTAVAPDVADPVLNGAAASPRHRAGHGVGR